MNKRSKAYYEEILKDVGADALLVTGEPNMRYLTGFCGEGYVLITRDDVFVVTDSRYTISAKEQCAECSVVEWDKKGIYSKAMEISKRDDIRRIGFEDTRMSVAEYNTWEKKLKSAKLVPIKDKVTKIRACKSDEEIKKISEAESIGDRAFARLMLDFGVDAEELGDVGKRIVKYHIPTPIKSVETTEKQVAAKLEFYLKDEGGENLSFDTIAASGLNGAKPHAIPTDKLLKKGELLTLDFGCVYEGYCSDMTRTVAIGRVDKKLKEIYDIVYRAQKKALDGICPGMTGMEIDALARDLIDKEGYGKYFGHSLGHSVGLEIHERPGFSKKEKTVIEKGMVISVEPGIYVEGVGGVRIEDLVTITDTGITNLAHSVKHLITLP